MKKLILINLLILTFSSLGPACPLGENETELTIQRVMRNFGRFIMPAEMIAYRGLNKYEDITDNQLDEAINKLNLVISCTQAVIDSPKGALLPAKAKGLSGEKLTEYIDDLVYFMGEFKDSIESYQDLFVKARALPKEQRDYAPVYKYTKEQDILIERAHKKLME